MRRVTVLSVLSLFLVSLALAQSYSPEEQKIVDETLSRWKNFSEGNYDAVVTGPKDLVGIQASSHGGLWEKATAEEQLNALKNTPYTLRATPYHIQMMFLESAKDVAYVTYYLSGSITLKDGTLIDNYRTRASEILEKTDGQWVSRGAHYSKLFEGSGIPSTN
jgi:ketosteroid isomerase-like protein